MVEWWTLMVERWNPVSLNIKDEETHQLTKRLAQLTGESLSLAVKVSVKERLERQESASRKESRMEWLNRITAETAAVMNDGRTSKELIDELYDEETGLPK
jgi:antitoxin VapB